MDKRRASTSLPTTRYEKVSVSFKNTCYAKYYPDARVGGGGSDGRLVKIKKKIKKKKRRKGENCIKRHIFGFAPSAASLYAGRKKNLKLSKYTIYPPGV